jgi:hypothetical protein
MVAAYQAMMAKRLFCTVTCALVCALAQRAHADLAAVYIQGNGGVTSGTVDDLGSGNAALGGRAGARIMFGELYLDRAGLASAMSTTRYVLGVHGGLGLAGITLNGAAGVGYLTEHAADATMPVDERHGAIMRVGGGLETGLSHGLHAGAALEAESFVVGSTGSDVFGYLYLKLQIGV